MKNYFLIFGIVIFAGLLSGCAKSNPVNNYHSYKYYQNHKKQAKAVLKMCEKIPAFVKQNSKKFDLSKVNENCFNALKIYQQENSEQTNQSLGSSLAAGW